MMILEIYVNRYCFCKSNEFAYGTQELEHVLYQEKNLKICHEIVLLH